jgi:hypothetical protein
MGPNFSNCREDKLLQQLRSISPRAEEYILNINANTWRNTEWLRTPNLPPRYGFFTSNNSESANSMFKDARGHNWLRSLYQMFHIIMVKMAKLKQEYKDKKGMISMYQKKYRQLFDKSATYDVLLISEELKTYKVYMGVGDDYNHSTSHVINVEHETCTCGRWQDTELFCIHAMTHQRSVEGKSIREILEAPYCHYYSYQSLNRLYNENINPVVIDLLEKDNITKHPTPNNKLQAGRQVDQLQGKFGNDQSRTELLIVATVEILNTTSQHALSQLDIKYRNS